MRIRTTLFLVVSALFLYCFLFVPPFTPLEISNIGDSLLYLAPGLRMYHGELMYRDFFEFVTPGTGLVHLLLFKLFGVRLWIPNVLALLLGLGLVWTGIGIARKVVQRGLALLPSAAFLVGTHDYLTDPVHHWYSMLAGLVAILVLLERRTLLRIALAGGFCGLSASFTQTRGFAAYVGVAVYLLWEAWAQRQDWRSALRRQSVLFAGALGVFLIINGYFIWKAGPARYFWCTVIFVLKYYPKEADWNTFQTFYSAIPTPALTRAFAYNFLEWLFWFVLSPLTYLAFFIAYARNARRISAHEWARPMIVAIVGLSMFLCVAPAPNPNRMSVSILPALVLLVFLISRTVRVRRYIFPAAVVLIVAFGLHDVIRRLPGRDGTIVTPQGRFVTTEQLTYDEYTWIQQHTRPGDYFYEADFSDIYFYLGLRNPTILPRAVTNGYTTAPQVSQAIGELEQHKPRFIFWGIGDPLVVPPWEDPADEHLQPMLDYIHSHYKRVQVYPNLGGSDEIWGRTAP